MSRIPPFFDREAQVRVAEVENHVALSGLRLEGGFGGFQLVVQSLAFVGRVAEALSPMWTLFNVSRNEGDFGVEFVTFFGENGGTFDEARCEHASDPSWAALLAAAESSQTVPALGAEIPIAPERDKPGLVALSLRARFESAMS